MKQITAFFKLPHTYPSRVSMGVYKNVTRDVYGKVTFKNDKLSISIQDRNYLQGVSIIEAKIRAEFKDYKNSSIFWKITETSDSLVDELREATKDLKKDYIEKTKATARMMYDYAVVNYPIIEKKAKEAFKDYSLNRHRQYSELSKEASRLESIATKGFDMYLKSELQYAELHYESSLLKLADRLVAKGISKDYKITSGYVGVNFEVVITHELGKVRAWTIIAEGEIRRAHYRYLVK